MKKSRSYSATPLFSIQEAVDSSSSINQMGNNHPYQYEQDKLTLLLTNYNKSENEYLIELKILEKILLDFDPVYNNYFDSSLDDITNEMVSIRQEKNNELLNIVQQIIVKHTSLIQIISNNSDFDDLVYQLSNWGKDVVINYNEYLKFYKLDVLQAKTEVKIRRRPMIRVRYLNTFFKNLKDILITIDERPNSSEIISNMEVIIFKLTKCLENCRKIDENEKARCDSLINFTNAKDIVSLKNVGVQLNQNDLNNSEVFIVDLHYLNINESASLNFMKLELFITSSEYILLVQKDSFGKTLVFTPIKKSEFQFHKGNIQNNLTSLLFNHSIHSSKIQLCFTFDTQNERLNSILNDFFPKLEKPVSLSTVSFGLGIMVPKVEESVETLIEEPLKEPLKEPVEEPVEGPVEVELKLPSPKAEFTSDIPKLDKQHNIPDLIDSTTKRDFFTEILVQTANDEVSDDESENIEQQSYNSENDNISLPPINRLPTPVKSIIPQPTEVKETEIKKTITRKPTLDLSKYQNSIDTTSTENPKRKKSLFGSFSNLLSKKKSSSSISSNNKIKSQTINNIPDLKPKEVSPTKSLHSISSSINDEILSIISNPNCVSKSISIAKISLWTSNSWTKSRETSIILHCLNDKFYLGFYNTMIKSISDKTISSLDTNSDSNKPILLIKINENTDCTFNIIDIHVTTESYKGNNLTIMIKPSNRQDMRIISNVLVNPDIIDSLLVNNNESYDSEVSYQSDKMMLPKMDSFSSIESEIEIDNVNNGKGNEFQYEEQSYATKHWTSVASLKKIENDVVIDLNRCVLSVENKGNNSICIDLTGFEFGNIELNICKEQIDKIQLREVLVKRNENEADSSDYILNFDSISDVNLFYECIY